MQQDALENMYRVNMCGLIGAVDSGRWCVGKSMAAGLLALRHRGPNHHAVRNFSVAGSDVWLGHTRLSIIDLNSEANQPMVSQDGRFIIIFNGEIYNYLELRQQLRARGLEFRTSSDTEVLLRAWEYWGDDCLGHLDGMFAFAVLDKAERTLTCVRDAFGVKPFFYANNAGMFCFASEIPALLKLFPTHPVADLQRCYDYLVHGDYDSNEQTFIDGVRHLMPAHAMVVDVGSGAIKSVHRWWRPSIEQTSRLSFGDAAEVVRDLFLRNVRRQLRSDVPLGVALSGGVDSSAVVCAIRHLEPDIPIHTFSFVASDAVISEERWIDRVNEHVHAFPHKVRATAGGLAADMDDLVRAQGEPFGSTSIYAQYKVFEAARDAGITVTLDGQGADELLAGYVGYPGYRMLSHTSKGQYIRALRFARAWRRWPGRGYASMFGEVARGILPGWAYANARALAGRETAPEWVNTKELRAAGVEMVVTRSREGQAPKGRWVVRQLRSSLQYRGLPGLLRHGDRNSMRFSVESRVPFLSTDLCEFLYSLPEHYLISEVGETKSVFRAAMRGIIPDDVLNRRDKVGFATPERVWLQAIAPVFRTWLAAADGIPVLHQAGALRAFDGALSDPRMFNWRIWRMLNFVRWWKQANMGTPVLVAGGSYGALRRAE